MYNRFMIFWREKVLLPVDLKQIVSSHGPNHVLDSQQTYSTVDVSEVKVQCVRFGGIFLQWREWNAIFISIFSSVRNYLRMRTVVFSL